MRLLWVAILSSFISVVALCGCLSGCSSSGRGEAAEADSVMSAGMPLPDTLRVVTLYSPTSYFTYRDTEMGYDYDMVSRFASDKKLALELEIAPSLLAAVAMLDSGMVDIIAYEVPVTAEYLEHILPCGVESVTRQVLVQPKTTKDKRISDVTQLVGREVYVEKDSKYHYRLNNLNEELGGGIIVKPIDRDTLITEDLIAMVSEGEIPLTVVDSDIARINKTYYNDLDITLEVSFAQRAAWGVSPATPWLADSINTWAHEEQPRRTQAALLKRYYELSKVQQAGPLALLDFPGGRMSRFDALFRHYASTIGWDWRLLASMGFAESRFDSTQVSWAGARGIMQLMPSTARAYGVPLDKMTDNEVSIATAARVVKDIDRSLSAHVKDAEERKKFVIASYNSGIAHVLDAIALAKKLGYDSQKWNGSVNEVLLLKSKPEYYNDPVCRYGYFRGRQTYEYVNTVYACYEKALRKVPK